MWEFGIDDFSYTRCFPVVLFAYSVASINSDSNNSTLATAIPFELPTMRPVPGGQDQALPSSTPCATGLHCA